MTVIKTWTGRELRVTVEVDWQFGRVHYIVAGVGTFTFERDAYGVTDDRASTLRINYGRRDGDGWDQGEYPDAPVVFGVQLGGGFGFDPDKHPDWLKPSERTHYRWHAMRAGNRGEAPAQTRRRVHEICTALLNDYLTRDDYAAIEQARNQHLAPKRLRIHTKRITELRDEIAKLQAELGTELAGADVQAEMTRPGRRDASHEAA